MDEMQFVGLAVTTIITLGAFIAVITKFTQPINDLRVVIQKLNDRIDSMKEDDDRRDDLLTKHTDQIEKLDNRMGKVETKMKIYHNE